MNPIPVLQPDEIEEDRPMPSRNHSIVCQNLGGILHRFRETISTHQQLSLSLDGWKVIPDVCVYPREADGPPIVNVGHYRLRQDSHFHPITLREEPAEFRARRSGGAS